MSFGKTGGELSKTDDELQEDGRRASGRRATSFRKTDDELPKTDDGLPKTDDGLPKTDDELPKTNGELPKTNGELPKTALLITETRRFVPGASFGAVPRAVCRVDVLLSGHGRS